MSINYYLMLAADIEPSAMVERITPCLPQPLSTPSPFENGLGIDLYRELGFYLTISRPRQDEYAGGSIDDGEWSWELPVATPVSFLLGKDYEGERSEAENILTVVAQIMATGSEDLALTFEFEYLYLLREKGVVTKNFRAGFWDHYPSANHTIPG